MSIEREGNNILGKKNICRKWEYNGLDEKKENHIFLEDIGGGGSAMRGYKVVGGWEMTNGIEGGV